MTPEETKNLAVTEHWVQTYNDEVDRMVDDCYAPDCEVMNMATGQVYRGREELRKLEHQISAASPERRMKVERMIAAGDTVIVEAVGQSLFPDGSPRELAACVVLTFKEGLIITDHTYAAPPRPAAQ